MYSKLFDLITLVGICLYLYAGYRITRKAGFSSRPFLISFAAYVGFYFAAIVGHSAIKDLFGSKWYDIVWMTQLCLVLASIFWFAFKRWPIEKRLGSDDRDKTASTS